MVSKWLTCSEWRLPAYWQRVGKNATLAAAQRILLYCSSNSESYFGPFFFSLFYFFFYSWDLPLNSDIHEKKKKGMEGNHRIMGCERAEHLVTLPMQPGVWESGWSHLAQRSKNMYSDGKKRQSNSRRVMQPDVMRKSGQYVLRRGSGKTPLLVYNHNAHHIVWSLILCPGTCYFMLYSTYLI